MDYTELNCLYLYFQFLLKYFFFLNRINVRILVSKRQDYYFFFEYTADPSHLRILQKEEDASLAFSTREKDLAAVRSSSH